MKSLNLKLTALILISSGFLLSSCYKKFDTKSYAPPLSIGGFTSTAEIGQGSLVGYWAFDGSLVDSVSKTSGTNTGTSFTKGIKGQALQGANNGYVLFNPGTAITGVSSFTITFWVNSPVNTNGIVGLVNLSNTKNFWGNIDMFFENGSTADAAHFKAHITNGNGKDHWIDKPGIPAVFNNWTAMAVSYDNPSSTFKYYVNGNLLLTQVDTAFGSLHFADSGPMVFGTVHFQTNPSLTSGSGSQPWASYLTGQLDEVRFYNKALSNNEVSSMVKLQGRGK